MDASHEIICNWRLHSLNVLWRTRICHHSTCPLVWTSYISTVPMHQIILKAINSKSWGPLIISAFNSHQFCILQNNVFTRNSWVSSYQGGNWARGERYSSSTTTTLPSLTWWKREGPKKEKEEELPHLGWKRWGPWWRLCWWPGRKWVWQVSLHNDSLHMQTLLLQVPKYIYIPP